MPRALRVALSWSRASSAARNDSGGAMYVLEGVMVCRPRRLRGLTRGSRTGLKLSRTLIGLGSFEISKLCEHL